MIVISNVDMLLHRNTYKLIHWKILEVREYKVNSEIQSCHTLMTARRIFEITINNVLWTLIWICGIKNAC